MTASTTASTRTRSTPPVAPFLDENGFPVTLTRREVASILNVHPTTFDRLVKEGELPGPCVTVGRSKRWARATIMALFDVPLTADPAPADA